MDADQQHDPSLIPLFVNLTQYGFDLVIGSRFAPGAGRPHSPFTGGSSVDSARFWYAWPPACLACTTAHLDIAAFAQT